MRLWRMIIDIGNNQPKYNVLARSEHLKQQTSNTLSSVLALFLSEQLYSHPNMRMEPNTQEDL